jgi:GWxTD domain-containing protein
LIKVKRKYYSGFFWILTTVILSSCSSNNILNNNFSDLYKDKQIAFEPRFVFFNNTKDSTEMYYLFNSKELLYMRSLKSDNYVARVSIHYKIYPSFREVSNSADSGMIYFEDTVGINQIDVPRKIAGKNTLYIPEGRDWIAEIKVEDLNRHSQTVLYFQIIKSEEYNPDDYLLLHPVTGLPYFKRFLTSGDSVFVKTKTMTEDKLYVWYQSPDYTLPPPPFSVSAPKLMKYDADYLYQAKKIDSLQVFAFRFKEQGIYQFKSQLNAKTGKSVQVFYEGYPKMMTYENMVAPLRFLTTKNEFEELTENPNKRVAVENFWLEVGQNKNRARELIKEFYSRVELANKLFTTYQEGWRTDRGMIYLIFGPPNSVYKTNDSESWVYGEDNNLMSINFVFIKKEHPFTQNLYILNRSSIYQTVWYRAVDMWRQGRIVQNNFQ